jgi:uncharacterized membrane protein
MVEKDKIEKELAEIKELVKRADRRATVQFLQGFGLAGILGAYVLKDASPVGALIIFILSLAVMVGAPYTRNRI